MQNEINNESDNKKINNLEQIPLYLECQNNQNEVDSKRKNTLKPIPYSSWKKKQHKSTNKKTETTE